MFSTKTFNKSILTALIVVLSLLSCAKQKPQLPSNKQQQGDSAVLLMQELHRELIQQEELALKQFAESELPDMTQSEHGFYYRIERENPSGATPADAITISYYIMDLSGNQLFTQEESYFRFGKKELPFGLEEALKVMKTGETATFLIPWYLAYGQTGNDKVPPLTSLLVEMKILNER